jgi:hypothetical protein
MKNVSLKDMLLGFFVGVTTCLLTAHFSAKTSNNARPLVLIPAEINESLLKTVEITELGMYNEGTVTSSK